MLQQIINLVIRRYAACFVYSSIHSLFCLFCFSALIFSLKHIPHKHPISCEKLRWNLTDKRLWLLTLKVSSWPLKARGRRSHSEVIGQCRPPLLLISSDEQTTVASSYFHLKFLYDILTFVFNLTSRVNERTSISSYDCNTQTCTLQLGQYRSIYSYEWNEVSLDVIALQQGTNFSFLLEGQKLN